MLPTLSTTDSYCRTKLLHRRFFLFCATAAMAVLLLRLPVQNLLLGTACAAETAPANKHPSLAPAVGTDLLPIFSDAHAGRPLRAVAIGGSITQAGNGWIGPWLKTQFPQSAVQMYNAGVSATGSDLGVFRLERDVISLQPHLVLIEFAVNDGGEPDDDVIWYLESIIVRLKRLPRPPAIVFVETAFENGSNRARHEKVAGHYGFLNIDLQNAVDAHLAGSGDKWRDLYTDGCHPNEKGHAFYADVISKAIAPFVERARSDSTAPGPIPGALSKRPLLLDGRLVPLVAQEGWKQTDPGNYWYKRFFGSVLECNQPGFSLEIPFRGTCVGLWIMRNTSFGQVQVGVDGKMPIQVECGKRGGYSNRIIETNLPAGEHIIRLALPQGQTKPVQAAYLLVAGDNGISTPAKQEQYTGKAFTEFAYVDVPARLWKWIGPFGGTEITSGTTTDFATAFGPELDGYNAAKSYKIENGKTASWQPVPASTEGTKVDLKELTGFGDRGVCYAYAELTSEHGGARVMSLQVDYFAKIWINGELAAEVNQAHGSSEERVLLPVTLKQGPNTFLLKIHSGSQGNNFSVGFSK